MLPRAVWRTLYTVPMPPCPSSSRTSWRREMSFGAAMTSSPFVEQVRSGYHPEPMLRPVAVIACALLLLTCSAIARAEQGLDLSGEAYGFVGDTKCGNPTCHGSGLPTNDAEKASWKPWKSARTQ